MVLAIGLGKYLPAQVVPVVAARPVVPVVTVVKDHGVPAAVVAVVAEERQVVPVGRADRAGRDLCICVGGEICHIFYIKIYLIPG
jgi:hypothetical protein